MYIIGKAVIAIDDIGSGYVEIVENKIYKSEGLAKNALRDKQLPHRYKYVTITPEMLLEMWKAQEQSKA